ncbi:hypothetical protein DLJ53_06965 [Acuticoccus sediminis]|uniref:Uncharacterized protein n=1 Tax=Acuticoccus sediminis TaxID=2184697 RepID=A0A8B2P4Z4_9HYPH|nr:hypothetical protein [Acuticoccus sediminis]RAI04182.1 hypothetical protein DLJ53_06965 [Acuticoccus sediminis]
MVTRMVFGFLVAAFGLVSVASAADQLSAQEIRDFMLGSTMSGILVETNERWYECVAPSGDTVYNIEGHISTGFVEISESGETCFTYPRPQTTSQSCFFVEMKDGKKVFVAVDSKLQFRVDSVSPGFEQCPTSAPVS